MKKNVLILVVFGLALLTGCAKKTTTTTNNNNFGGTWTFKSKTYHPNSSSRTESIIVVKDSFN
ncbi:MAG: hypothetical protein JWO03_2524, partial [Bacteroidetes bacterium]|nr:hypothetical protein [Bacteroidota bacterium]